MLTINVYGDDEKHDDDINCFANMAILDLCV